MSRVHTEPEAGIPPARRRGPWVALALLVVAALVAVGLLVSGRGGEGSTTQPDAGGSPAATGTAAPATSAPATSAAAETDADAGAGTDAAAVVAATPTAQGSPDLPEDLPAVALDEPVAVDAVTMSVVSLEAIDGQASGPGNVSGPAVRVTVRITNDGSAPLVLDGAVVTVVHGADATPAAPLDDPSALRFTGSLAAGESAAGVYVFSVPAEQRGDVRVQVAHQPGAPVAVFTGAAG
ncbi:hypothetical protein [Modestobacter sp. VKM Ac-2985]|uniref:hypothetical protein n=1 Tax=Modestobacter sp. VKM Ac-2985 TaxID=3004139 RepID=UPI0022AB514A|nr:hypothetical protein [Modestobacter sp. VKM Ac-2985]MCZ2836432.1 hypothetical protein [Modestobacter sp. VKM Ac-2985]